MTTRRATATLAVLMMIGAVLATLQPAAAQGAPTCNGKVATIVGTDGNDRLEGTDANDVIVGGAGKDVIFGRGGNDSICGGFGNDVIKGGTGKDYIEGNQGNDKLIGGTGKDTMNGGSAKDKLFGGGGGDIMAGGSKKDFLNGQNGNDDCSLDRADRFTACETGDVVGVNGVTEGTFPVDVSSDFVVFNRGAGGGPSLQSTTPIVVVQFSTSRSGAGTTALTFFDDEGVILNSFSSVNNIYSGRIAIPGIPASFSVSSGGAPIAFDVAFIPYSLLFLGGPHLSGIGNLVYLADFPTDGPLDFQFMIGDEVTGSLAVFFYDANGEVTAPVFIPALRPEDPRQFALAVDERIRMIEVFAGGSWMLWLSEPVA